MIVPDLSVAIADEEIVVPISIDITKARACSRTGINRIEVVRNLVGKIDRLPSLPHIYSQLISVCSNENVTSNDVGQVLKQDMAMCAKLLQLVNSAFFGLSQKITNIEHAVTYLGFNLVKQLALAVDVYQRGNVCPNLGDLSLENLQMHGMLTGRIASCLLKDKQQKEDAFIAGLLHDIGKLILAMELPEHQEEVLTLMREDGVSMHTVEEKLCGVTHSEVGGYLLGLWSLPYSIVEAVIDHHVPTRVEQSGFDTLAAVHVADILANELSAPVFRSIPQQNMTLDPAYLQMLDVSEKLDGWREVAREQAQTLFAEMEAVN